MCDDNKADITQLLEKARAGDTASRDRLFEACRGFLGTAARGQVENWLRAKVDASDVVQETMLEAHRDFARFQGHSEKEFFAWLRKILSHNTADFVRRYRGTAKRQARREVRFRDPADSLSPGVAEPAGHEATPSQEFLRADNESRVHEALDGLSEDYRQVIELRNFQRLSFNEIAEAMDRTRPAVQMLWMRALNKLREGLEEDEVPLE